MDIALLYKEGRSWREIASLPATATIPQTRDSREAAASVLRPSRPCKLDPFKDYWRERFLDHGLSAVRLCRGPRHGLYGLGDHRAELCPYVERVLVQKADGTLRDFELRDFETAVGANQEVLISLPDS
jgi:hypothetical protein